MTQVDVPDSHDQRLEQVRRPIREQNRERQESRSVQVASGLIRSLVERIGFVEEGGDIPRTLRRQQWSVFNVPLMWSAACGDRNCGVLQWLSTVAASLSVSFLGESVNGAAAAHAGWDALCGAMREWGIHSREDLSEWIHRQGFPQPRWW